MNKVELIGNLTRDPELSETTNGAVFCRFGLAVVRPFTSGEKKQTDFFNITAWRAIAENCARYLKKGSKIGVVGSLQNRTYTDKNGEDKTVTEIIATEVEFLPSGAEQEDNGREESDSPRHAPKQETDRPKSAVKNKPNLAPMDDDIDFPF